MADEPEVDDEGRADLAKVKDGRKARLSDLAKKRKIGVFRKAYQEGDDTQIKKAAGDLMGRLYVKAREMLERIEEDGLVIEAPQVDRTGKAVIAIGADGVRDYIYEMKPHPLIGSLAQVLRLMKIDLHEFMLTPLAQGAGSPQLQGGIAATQINIEQLNIQQAEQIAQFREALTLAEKLRNADPVYQEHQRQRQRDALHAKT